MEAFTALVHGTWSGEKDRASRTEDNVEFVYKVETRYPMMFEETYIHMQLSNSRKQANATDQDFDSELMTFMTVFMSSRFFPHEPYIQTATA